MSIRIKCVTIVDVFSRPFIRACSFQGQRSNKTSFNLLIKDSIFHFVLALQLVGSVKEDTKVLWTW
uniref:Putative ovule protein n=1 Tax=Solanum chacoense TaxID=4108 RepID=A0A0V0GP93_SOLCH